MTAYYNEIDPVAAQWLRNLIAAEQIAPGVVDERSIALVSPVELSRFTQCHFFAGIGVWSYALRSAGWSDDRPIWTGSCPCQPFSAAGQKKGFDDERHLWPDFYRLIRERRPPILLGEQVASRDGLAWLDTVSFDLEGAGYAVGSSDLCAAGFSGAHVRQRLYFVGMEYSELSTKERLKPIGGPDVSKQKTEGPSGGGVVDGLVYAGKGGPGEASGLLSKYDSCGLADGDDARLQGRERSWTPGAQGFPLRHSPERGREVRPATPMLGRTPVDWLQCRDGRWRPVEPGSFPLANEAPSRVGRLRAYGNGLDAETATGFVRAVMETIPDFCEEPRP